MGFYEPVFFALLFAATAAIFPFGKGRKSDPDPLPEPAMGRTLTPLAEFTLTDAYADRAACTKVWDALAMGERGEDEPGETRYFAIAALDESVAGRDAAAQVAAQLSRDATGRGYSVLLIDADISLGLLHQFSLFAPRDKQPTDAPGVSEFLRVIAGRLEPLLKLAWRTEGLLLLPAGAMVEPEKLRAASTEKLLRAASALAEIVVVNAPPVFGDDSAVQNSDLLPRMDGVLIAFPSAQAVAGDTEALAILSVMGVPQVGAVIAPPAEPVETLKDEEMPPTVAAVYPVLPEESEPEPIAEVVTEAPAIEPEPAPEPLLPVAVEPEPVTPPVPLETPVPSFMTNAPTVESRARRGDSRRAVPVEAVPIYPAAPVAAPRPAPPAIVGVTATPEPVMTNTTYRPDVSLELLPATGETSTLVLRAEVGASGNGAVLVLEIRTLAAQSKRLRANNPGANTDALLVIESLVSDDAPEDVTTLR
ncbi:MAG: hypothetical protein H7Y38_03380, partial [Armatimonadetes bacterium]|nr:hypothetical protein [Armatimonadota bacterium]